MRRSANKIDVHINTPVHESSVVWQQSICVMNSLLKAMLTTEKLLDVFYMNKWFILTDISRERQCLYIINYHYKNIAADEMAMQANRPRYGMSFVDPASDRYSASIPVIINAIDYNIWPRYNDTRLYWVLPEYSGLRLCQSVRNTIKAMC